VTPTLSLFAIPAIPLIEAGADLAAIIADALRTASMTLQDGDVLVVTSKIVSKAEGRRVLLADVVPSDEALRLAGVTGKDPRLVELVLRESTEVSRATKGVLVVRHRLGFVSANAGIDQSNVEGGDDVALLLPHDPDASAAHLREALHARLGVRVGVIISDSHGRAWRMGNIGVAIGVAGLPALRDLRGNADLFGRPLKITLQGYADMIASAAALLTGEGAEGLPVVCVRGLSAAGEGQASDLNRPPEQDLYR
jgi:coenzyme F420-0:L-glutamate ligase/coenzyme F420-1:gamma-L-glutamate ligase